MKRSWMNFVAPTHISLHVPQDYSCHSSIYIATTTASNIPQHQTSASKLYVKSSGKFSLL